MTARRGLEYRLWGMVLDDARSCRVWGLDQVFEPSPEGNDDNKQRGKFRTSSNMVLETKGPRPSRAVMQLYLCLTHGDVADQEPKPGRARTKLRSKRRAGMNVTRKPMAVHRTVVLAERELLFRLDGLLVFYLGRLACS
jgi:hypothetical protein